MILAGTRAPGTGTEPGLQSTSGSRPPGPRLREYVEALRAIWRCWEHGEPLRYEGEHFRFSLMTPEFAPSPSGLPPIPVTIAAVGPQDEIAERIAERFGGVSDSVALAFPPGTPLGLVREVVQDIRGIPAQFAGFPSGHPPA